MKALFAGAIMGLALVAGAADAAPSAWPDDLKGALQGKWVAENNARSIEITGDEVVIRSSSQFKDTYFGAVGSVMATVGSEDVSRASDTHRFFNGTCINASTNFKPAKCISYVNKPPNEKFLLLQINDDRYSREADLSDWSKEHRLRQEP
jgi:hypothetical protein